MGDGSQQRTHQETHRQRSELSSPGNREHERRHYVHNMPPKQPIFGHKTAVSRYDSEKLEEVLLIRNHYT